MASSSWSSLSEIYSSVLPEWHEGSDPDTPWISRKISVKYSHIGRTAIYIAKLTEDWAQIVYNQSKFSFYAGSFTWWQAPHRCYQQSSAQSVQFPHNGQLSNVETIENHIPSQGSSMAIAHIRAIPRWEYAHSQLGGPLMIRWGTFCALYNP